LYNKTSSICQVLPPNATNPSGYPKLLLSDPSDKPTPQSTDVACPENKPFYNGTDCVICIAPTYLFDYAKKTRGSCPENTKFNASLNKCVVLNNDFVTVANATNLINAGMPTQYWNKKIASIQAKNSSTPTCTEDKPYYDGTSCISCPEDSPYFNLAERKCQNCTGDFVYNPKQR
jgi:hypothetical protein